MDPVTHFELPAEDMKRAQEFYSDAFGWTFSAPPGMEGQYEMAMTSETGEDMRPTERGRIDGALYSPPDEAGVLITIEVESIDEALKRVEEAGGEIVQPKADVMGYGLYARFRDTEGNLMSLWQPTM
jgi:predicted enzyme related to lactoylglutathione lyase